MSEPRPLQLGRGLDRVASFAWRFLVAAAAGFVIFQALLRLRLVVLPVIFAFFIAALLEPVVSWLRAHGWRPLLATWAVYLAGLAVAVGLGFAIVPQFVNELDTLGQTVAEGIDEVRQWLRSGPLGISGDQGAELVQRVREQITQNAGRLASGLLAGASLLFEVIAGLLLTLVLGFFFLKDSRRISAALLGLVREDVRDDLCESGRRVARAVRGYLLGSAIVGLVDAVAIGIALFALDVPLVLPLMALIFFGAFIPIVGAFVSGLLAALVTLVTQGLVPALIVTGVTVVVQQVEGDVVAPLVFRRTVALHPAVILLALTTGGILLGIVGAILAVPVAASAASVLDHFRRKPA